MAVSNTPETKLPSSDNKYYDQARLDALVEILSYKYDDLFEALGVSLGKTQKMYMGCCPIHGGDNPAAINLYTDGYAVKGFWKCRTHHCEQTFKRTLIGFIRGVLSHNKRGWSKHEDKTRQVSFRETIDWICNFLNQDINNIQVNTEEVKNKKFIVQMESMVKKKKEEVKGFTRKQVRSSLEIPARFFLDKGYSKEILDAYDVGLCKNPAKEMGERVVVPVYDSNNNIMECCTGRSIHPKCDSCLYYHNPKMDCPLQDKYVGLKYSKWRNSANSNISSHLYNYWLAKKSIRETGTIILVEGPADIWKLEELGIHNAVALFGTEMSDEQQVLIEMCGALNVVILLDMDEPGRMAIAEIRKKLERSYRVYVPQISVNDPGDYTPKIIEEELTPILKSIQR